MRQTWFVVALVSIGCTGPERPLSVSLRPGELAYRASTAAGQPLVEGRLELVVTDDTIITGTWHIGWAPGADTTLQVGPQFGDGQLLGRRIGDRFAIGLNEVGPQAYNDNNVYLLATPTNAGWRGEWVWSTIAGPAASGPFSALRE